ncbi:MAG: hypothetical protein ABIU96_03935 [Rhodanobacter sp.]
MIGLQADINLVAGWVRDIRVANGYTTDIGADVVTERKGGSEDDNSLLCGVFLADLTPTNATPQRRDWQPDIVIEARIPVRSATAEATLIAVIEDLVKAIPTKTTDAANNIATLEISAIGISRQPDGVPYIVVSVTLRATVYEFISQPA